MIDFRQKPSSIVPLTINGQTVEIVNSFKFLGTVISNDLKWDSNTSIIIKKCHQRLYFLRQLKKFGVSGNILVQFYRAVIESVLTFSITVWYGSLTAGDNDRIDRIVFTASKIIGLCLDPIQSIYIKRSKKKVNAILACKDHPASQLFVCLPSGRRYRSILAKTDRFINSFYIKSIRELL